jgi:multiple sugar transport system substrate-binding protein
MSAGATVVAGGLALSACGPALAAQQSDITIVIHQSPWFESFRQMVNLYTKETGNKVKLDVNPYSGMIDKERNSVRSPAGEFDVLIMNPLFYQEIYAGGFVTPFTDIDPNFKLDPAVITYGDTIYWDAKTKAHDPKNGAVVAMPVNGNMNFLVYRRDLYEAKGLSVPKTWDEFLANAIALNDPPKVYGNVERSSRGDAQISYNYMMYLHSFNASIFRDEKGGDFTVTLNSPESKKALDFYLDLNHKAGHPNFGSIDQGQMVQQFLTGKAAHILTVNAFFADFDNPDKSLVVGKWGAALLPHGPGGQPAPAAGHWMAAIAKNVPPDRQKAALAFLEWFVSRDNQVRYLDNGGVVVRQDIYDDPKFADQPKFSWFKAYAESTPFVEMAWTVPEGSQIQTVLDLRLNQAAIGELSPSKALNTASDEIYKIMSDAGYKTGKLPDLAD